MFDIFTKRIARFIVSTVMATSNVMPMASIVSENIEPDLTYQSIELYPNGEEAEQIVTLDGMMPEGAKATAVDVSEEHDGIAAYDITIKNGWREYQPGEENPIKVEITDPVISDSVTLWHIHDNGKREQLFDFTAEDGKVSFLATGFSVYEIVNNEIGKNITSTVIPVTGSSSAFDTYTVTSVGAKESFTYDVVSKEYPQLYGTATQITDLDVFKANAANGIYISGNRFHLYVKNTDCDITGSRPALGVTSDYNDSDINKNLFNATASGAVKYYFEEVSATNNQYYIYTYDDENDINTKKYVNLSGNNALKYSTTQQTVWVISMADSSFRIKCINNNCHWTEKGDTTVKGFATFLTNSPGAGEKFDLWLYTPPSFATDPYGLDGNTYGLVSYKEAAKGNALMAGNFNNTGTQLGNIALNRVVDSETNAVSYSADYGITGWKFDWIKGTTKYKISAIADDGAGRKYLKITSSGISLEADAAEASEITVTPNNKNMIQLSADGYKINCNNDTNFIVSNNSATVFELVNISSAQADSLELDGNTYALINKQDTIKGNAMMALADLTANRLDNQIVPVTETGYIFSGGLSGWTFHNVDTNHYTISNGSQYLKLVNGILTLSDTPFILTVVAGTGDNAGKISIRNVTDKRIIIRNKNENFYDTGIPNNVENADRWFDLSVISTPPTADPFGLDGKTYGIINQINSTSGNAVLTEGSLSGLAATYSDSSGKGVYTTQRVVPGWTFHWQGNANYKLSANMGNGITKWLSFTSSGVALVDESQATAVNVIVDVTDHHGKIQIRPLLDTSISALGKDGNNHKRQTKSFSDLTGSQFWYDLVKVSANDPYKLNGKTYGLMNYVSGAAGDALIADNNGNALEMLTCIVRTKNSGNKMLYVAQDTDITEWTFEYESEDRYYLYADFGGTKKYLNIGTTDVTISDTPQAIKVTPNTAGKIMLSANGKKIGFIGNSDSGDYNGEFIASDTGVYLSFVDLTEIADEDELVTYKAKEVSVSEVKNGEEIIIYTRVWNGKGYDFYAIDHDGSLVPCYERGDSIMWLSNKVNTMIWEFNEYYYEYTTDPNFYYDLYNPYSGKYIAPRRSDTVSPTLDDAPIGINLDGRRNNEYYTTILAWDQLSFAFSGLKTNVTGNDKQIAVSSRAKAETFYFARVVDLKNELTEVETVDNSQHGITMKMVNFGGAICKPEGADTTVQQHEVMGRSHYSDANANKQMSGLLSTDLSDVVKDENGKIIESYPIATETSRSFGDLFSDATEVNHLFIQSILDQSGYFEYDSCQNYATLKKADGSLGTDFFVSKEIGTHDNGNKPSLKHGQFFPYDDIEMDTYASLNSQNIYDATKKELSNDDPRKYERLHLIEDPDYYFGMELNAGFTQTPSGKDNWGHDIIFEFTGDDDFWLYVDGELVIDLGGIHSALAGNVNFANGDLFVNGDTTNLRDQFVNNFIERKKKETGSEPTAAEIEAFLTEKHFGLNKEAPEGTTGAEKFEKIFDDYTNHTMKIFYMERGAGASNLHMRFNLSYVTPGNVTMTKQVSGSDDIDFELVEYPFQIWYCDDVDQQGNHNPNSEHLLTYDDANVTATYQNSTKKVIFQDSYTPPGSTETFNSVFFINPHQSVEIHFPQNTTHYKIVECGINSEVYDHVYINGTEITGQDTAESTPSRKKYESEWVSVSDRTAVMVDNHVNPDGLRSLVFQKKLFDSDYSREEYDAIQNDSSLSEEQKKAQLEAYVNKHKITAEQDPTTFSFRLYLSNGLTDELELTNMFKYRIKDPEGYYCTWDMATQKFVRYVSDNKSYNSASLKSALDAIKAHDDWSSDKKAEVKEALLEPITFETSINGQISNVPAWFSVEVPNLPVGILFKVEERDGSSERPLGYDRVKYERIEGTYITASGTPDNVGVIRANESPQMNVINQRGYEVQAKKIWSDRDFALGHDDIYTALYINNHDGTYTLAPAAVHPVRKLSSPDTEIRYFMQTLVEGKALSDYEIFEVKLTNPVFDVNGYATSYDNIERINNGGLAVLHATDRVASVDPDKMLIKNLTCNDTSNDSNWSNQTHFDSGSRIYGDIDVKAVDVPAKLRGAEYIRTADASKNFSDNLCTFTLDAEAIVYVAVDPNARTLDWLSSWNKTQETITASNNVKYDVYRKGFTKGNTVTLGSNGTNNEACNYFVMAATRFSYKTDYEKGSEVNPINIVEGKKTWNNAENSSIKAALYISNGSGYTLANPSLYSIETLTAPDNEVRYYINTDDIPNGKTLDDYKIFEVTELNGTITRGDALTTTNRTYTARADTITNTRQGGIEINLYKMGTRKEADKNYGEPLAGGVFTLKKGNEVIGSYTSDSNGRITIMYNFERNTDYTLKQIAAPATYIMPSNTVTFNISAGDTPTITVGGNDEVWNNYHLPDEQGNLLVAYIDIYNKPFTLKAVKVDKDDYENLLEGVHFALYRAVNSVDGLIPDISPMSGYTDLVTDSDGVIPNITQNIPEGTYFLKETTPKSGYKIIDRYIRFVISGNDVSIVGSTITSEAGNIVTITSNTGVKLIKTDSINSYSCVMQIPNEKDIQNYYFDITKTIFIDKNIHNSDDEQKFVFKVERLDGDTNNAVECFYVTMNCASTVTDSLTLAKSTDNKYELSGTNPTDCQVKVTYDNAETYTFPAAVKSGTKTINVREKGRYRVSEVSRWSSTDYDFWKGSEKYTSKTGSQKTAETNHAGNDPYVIFTIDDTDAEKINLASVSFTNTETEYAYLSSQAYAENTIKRSST